MIDILGRSEGFWLVWSLVLPLLSTLVLIPILIRLDKKKHLSAKPNSRSSHIHTVPSIGGVAIFIAMLIGISPFLFQTMSHQIMFLLVSIFIIFLVGLKDDIIDSSPYFKLVAQTGVAFLLVEFAGFKITNFHGIMGIYELPSWIGLIITIILTVAIINAANFIDGIDGLAAMTGILGCTISAVAFLIAGEIFFVALQMVLISALIGFLKFNFSRKKKVFMGDTGSLLIGIALSASVLKIWSLHGIHPALPTNSLWVLSIMLLPLYDLMRVFLIRIVNKKSPLRADRNHVHHVLVDHGGYSHKRATSLLSGIAFFLMVFSYILAYSEPYILYLWYVILFIAFTFTLHHLHKNALRTAPANPFDETKSKLPLDSNVLPNMGFSLTEENKENTARIH